MGWDFIFVLVCFLLASSASADNVLDGDDGDGDGDVSDADGEDDQADLSNAVVQDEKRKGKYQHLSKEVKDLKKQVEDMLQEIRNQNHAIFKHADHNRILSGKVSDMSKEIKALSKDKVSLEDRLQLLEFKTAKKVKKLKTKLSGLDNRLDSCRCPTQSALPGMQPTSGVATLNPSQPQQSAVPTVGVGNGFGGGYGMVGTGVVTNNYHHGYSNEEEQEEENDYRRLQEEMDRKKRERKRRKKEERRRKKKERSKAKKHYKDKRQKGEQSWRVQGSNHIFITAGSSNTTEILDINSPRTPCPQFAEYPISVKGAVGTFIAGRPLVCGGRSSVEDYYSSCHSYHVSNDSWAPSEPLLERRFQATAIMIDAERWWVTGGFSGTRVYNTTEIYQPGKGFTLGPNLPEVTFQHCLVKINATHIFNVGGFPYSNKVWLMDFDSGSWTSMRPISLSRDAPHCARTERRNGKVEVVVAGGSLPGSELTTEIFSVTDNRWRQGPKLPRAVIYGASVAYRNSLLVLGGREMAGDLEELDLVYQYDALKEVWSQLPPRLDVPRTSFVAISLPEYLHCANNFKPPDRKDRRYYYNRNVDRYGRPLPEDGKGVLYAHDREHQMMYPQQQDNREQEHTSNPFNFFS